MLQLLANAPDGIKKDQLFFHCGVTSGKGELLFQRMVKAKLITVWHMNMLSGTTFSATHEGREYLDKHGLL